MCCWSALFVVVVAVGVLLTADVFLVEMGLGKTIESLGVILLNPRPTPVVGKAHMLELTKDRSVNACHRERIERGALTLGGTLVVCKVSLVGQVRKNFFTVFRIFSFLFPINFCSFLF